MTIERKLQSRERHKTIKIELFIFYNTYLYIPTQIAQMIRTYYDDGQLYEEYFENNGIKEGEYKSYWINGQLQIICNYVDGQLEGKWTTYYDSGQIHSVCNYVNNRIEGVSKCYFESGKISSFYIYVNGMIRKHIGYYEDGKSYTVI